MNTEDVKNAIIEVEGDALPYGVDLVSAPDEGEDFYCEFDYQVDDRKRTKGDEQIEEELRAIFGDEYGVSVDRVDAFPNGYALYKVTIDC